MRFNSATGVSLSTTAAPKSEWVQVHSGSGAEQEQEPVQERELVPAPAQELVPEQVLVVLAERLLVGEPGQECN